MLHTLATAVGWLYRLDGNQRVYGKGYYALRVCNGALYLLSGTNATAVAVYRLDGNQRVFYRLTPTGYAMACTGYQYLHGGWMVPPAGRQSAGILTVNSLRLRDTQWRVVQYPVPLQLRSAALPAGRQSAGIV